VYGPVCLEPLCLSVWLEPAPPHPWSARAVIMRELGVAAQANDVRSDLCGTRERLLLFSLRLPWISYDRSN